jgi:hypothetical protein
MSAAQWPSDDEIDSAIAAAGDLSWAWRWLDHYLTFEKHDQLLTWDRLLSQGEATTNAEFFWVIWTTGRYWDSDASLCYSLLTVFNQIQQEGISFGDTKVQEYIGRIKLACPYLVELDKSMDEWGNYLLPVERP